MYFEKEMLVMSEVVKETITTKGSTTEKATKHQTAEYVIYFIFGLLEILLVFRLVFKLMGANPASSFVNFIYSATRIFILPFEGIFRKGLTEGIETTSILEPSTFVAIIVYILIGWGIVKLVHVFSREKQEV
jgi:hypothetical protein